MKACKTAKKLKEEQCIKKMREIMAEKTPRAIEKLYALLDNEEMTPSTTLSVIKEILERSIGKGQLTIDDSVQEAACQDSKFELVLRVVE